MTPRADFQTLAADGMKALGAVHVYVTRSGLPRALLNLVYLRASVINGCAYCIDMHTHDLIRQGVPQEKTALVAAWDEAGDWFDARERAALAWTDAVTRVAETHVPDAAYQAAAQVFTDRELSDLTVAIGLINTYNRIAIGFRFAPESLARRAVSSAAG